MALFRLGPIVVEAAGSVGGVVFARSHAGQYGRARIKPVYPGTAKQSQRTALMSTLVAHWQGTLTNDERIAWNNLAKATTFRNRLGVSFSPSGFNMYARTNFLLDLTGQSLVTAAPAQAVTPAIPATMDYAEGTGCRVTDIDAYDTTPSGRFLFQRTFNLPQSRFFFKGPWDGLTWNNLVTLDALPWTAGPEAQCDQGKRNWFLYKVVLASGSISAPTVYSVDRAAA